MKKILLILTAILIIIQKRSKKKNKKGYNHDLWKFLERKTVNLLKRMRAFSFGRNRNGSKPRILRNVEVPFSRENFGIDLDTFNFIHEKVKSLIEMSRDDPTKKGRR